MSSSKADFDSFSGFGARAVFSKFLLNLFSSGFEKLLFEVSFGMLLAKFDRLGSFLLKPEFCLSSGRST